MADLVGNPEDRFSHNEALIRFVWSKVLYNKVCFYSTEYMCNSFIVDLRHKFTVRNMNEIPVFVQSTK